MWRAPIPSQAALAFPYMAPEPTAAAGALEWDPQVWDHPRKGPQLHPWPKECNPIAVLIPELSHFIKTVEFIPIQPFKTEAPPGPSQPQGFPL